MSRALFPNFCAGIWNREHKEVLRTQRVLSHTFLCDKDTFIVWEQSKNCLEDSNDKACRWREYNSHTEMLSHRWRFVYSFSLYQLYANISHPSPFCPIRTTFPPRLWPAPACPWKSCALWRVRARVQRSSHPQRSSTESMTWVRLPDLHLSTRKSRPLVPTGNTLGRWSCWMHRRASNV